MDNNWAAENLQVIRTIMERSTVYRRALAPVMIVSGSIGLIAATVPCFVKIQTNQSFSSYWLAFGFMTLFVSYLLVRRQALKENDPFWSAPTRRVTQALLPGFLVGFMSGLLFIVFGPYLPPLAWVLTLVWTFSYGCAIHSAGFFMQRGIKLFGWLIVIVSAILLWLFTIRGELQTVETAHYVMGSLFGIMHLAYGVYLYFTERARRTL